MQTAYMRRRLPPLPVLTEMAQTLTYQQIADRYGTSRSAVAAQMFRAGHRSGLATTEASLADRFAAKTEDGPGSDYRPDLGPCLLWTAARDGYGYGRIFLHMEEGRRAIHGKAHRIAWELAIGPIPAEMTIDHLCRVRACVRVEHLEVVTLAENIRRGNAVRYGKDSRVAG